MQGFDESGDYGSSGFSAEKCGMRARMYGRVPLIFTAR
jgi:hypothetical protein